MSKRSDAPKTRSTPTMQAEQKNISLETREQARQGLQQYGELWEALVQEGKLPASVLKDIKSAAGAV